MKILLLEDDVPLNNALKKLLQLDQHTVSSFFDGKQLMDTVTNFNYDVYILDINVPYIDGLELLQLIYSYNSQSKIIMISSNIDLLSIQKAYKYGACDYLKKPFHIEELLLKINQFNINDTSLLQNITYIDNEILTKKERMLLLLLLAHKGQTVTYPQIEMQVYQDKSMNIQNLRALVTRLRKKLQNINIETKINEGYFIT